MNSAYIKKKVEERDNVIEKINNEKNKISEYSGKIKIENINELNSKYKILDSYFEELEKLLQNDSPIKTDLDKKISNELNNLEEIYKRIKEINYPKIKNQIEESKNDINKHLVSLNKYEEDIDKFIKELKEEELEELFIDNWVEKCCIDNEYDLYEINFEFKCKMIHNENKRASQILQSLPLPQNKLIEMDEFKIDDKIVNNYKIDNSSLMFNEEIKFKNLVPTNFYLKYKQSNEFS